MRSPARNFGVWGSWGCVRFIIQNRVSIGCRDAGFEGMRSNQYNSEPNIAWILCFLAEGLKAVSRVIDGQVFRARA